MSKVEQPLLLIAVLILSGCNKNPFSKSTSLTTKECAIRPPTELILRNPQEVTLKSTLEKIGEGQISSTETVGYKFKGKSGQKLELELEPAEICIWIISPNAQVFKGTTFSETGTYLVQLTALQDNKMKYTLSMGLGNVLPSPTPNPLTSKTSTFLSSSLPTNQLSQEDAVEIVKGWYSAKSDIFGSNYQTHKLQQYATGKLYYETLEKCNDGICGGSVGWLKQYNCYYSYEFSDIKQIISFSSSSSEASLTVNIREKLQLHGPRSAGCGKSPQTYQTNILYWFKKDNGQWKLSEYKVEN